MGWKAELAKSDAQRSKENGEKKEEDRRVLEEQAKTRREQAEIAGGTAMQHVLDGQSPATQLLVRRSHALSAPCLSPVTQCMPAGKNRQALIMEPLGRVRAGASPGLRASNTRRE